MERLVNERSILLGYSLDTSSFGAYTSALNSYLTFCNIHHLPMELTQDTLSFYVVFLSNLNQSTLICRASAGNSNHFFRKFDTIAKVCLSRER